MGHVQSAVTNHSPSTLSTSDTMIKEIVLALAVFSCTCKFHNLDININTGFYFFPGLFFPFFLISGTFLICEIPYVVNMRILIFLAETVFNYFVLLFFYCINVCTFNVGKGHHFIYSRPTKFRPSIGS